MAVFNIWRTRTYNRKPEREIVRGNDDKPLAFPNKGQADAAANIFNFHDPDWHYEVSEPVTAEV